MGTADYTPTDYENRVNSKLEICDLAKNSVLSELWTIHTATH